MIKALMGNDLLFGISEENVIRLKKGMPIVFNLKEMGLEDRQVVIMYGQTEQDMYRELADNGLIDPIKTKFNHEKGSKEN